MGHRRVSAPHRSSLGYRRVRAKRIVPAPRAWQKYEGAPKLLGFLGFKAGMTHCIYIEDKPRSHLVNRELTVAVTCVETPPMVVFGLRGYAKTPYGLKIVGDIRTMETKEELSRRVKPPKKYDSKKTQKNFEKQLEKVVELRVVVHTQPYLTGIGMKTPNIAEIKIGCSDIKEGFEYGISLLGKEVLIRDVFKTGEFVEQYICPVDGCDKLDKRSPGAIIAHLILVADPDVKGHAGYDKGSHAAYVEKQGGPNAIKEFPRYLATLPRATID